MPSMQTAEQGVLTLPPPRAGGEPEVHAISIPRRAYTGDFWFARRVAGGLWFAVGDVAGKGAASAIWMAMIQEEIDAMLGCAVAADIHPAGVVTRIDEVLREELPPNRFATLLVGRLGDDGELEVANAGHCPLLIVRGDGRVERIDSTGPVAGILPGRRWDGRRAAVEPGDLLLAFSDGIAEARLASGEELGIEGVVRLAAPMRGTSARDAARTVATAVGAIAVDDDVTVLAVRLA